MLGHLNHVFPASSEVSSFKGAEKLQLNQWEFQDPKMEVR